MFPSQTAPLLFVATLLLFAATFQRLGAVDLDLELIRGPWLIERQSGGLRIGLEVLPHTDALLYGLVHLKNKDETFQLSAERMSETASGARVLLTFELSDEQRREQPFLEIHGVNAKPIPLALAQRPSLLSPVQVAFAGAYNYPLKEDIERLEREMGKDLQLVVLLGAGTAARVGVGGWEQRIPILALPDQGTVDAYARGIFGSLDEWHLGAHWGCVGMPRAPRDQEILQAINRGVFDWQIFLDTESRWDPGLMGKPGKEVAQLGDLLSVCSRKQLPLIIGAGSGSSFISEPLAVYTSQFSDLALRKKYITPLQLKSVLEDVKESGRSVESILVERGFMTQQQVIELTEDINVALLQKKSTVRGAQGVVQQSGGTRYIPANMAGIGFKQLGNEIALPLYRPGLLGVQASTQDCYVHLSFPESKPMRLHYSHDAKSTSTGWADYSVKEDLITLRQEHVYEKSLPALHWHLSSVLDKQLNTSSFDLRAVMDWSLMQEGEKGIILLRRLTQMDKIIVLSWLHQQRDAPQEMRRDCFLRCLKDASIFGNSDFQYIITHQTDEYIISGLLASMDEMEREQRLSFIDLLIKRLQLQASGVVALDTDPILQQRLMSRIFESPYHSPTQLRVLGHYMRKHGHSLAVGPQSPIQRFFDRHGE